MAIVLFVLSFGHCIVCPFFWPMYCLSFLLAIALSILSFGQCIVCPKDRQYNGQNKGQTIQWPKERTDNTMAKQKDKQYNGQFWPLYFLSFLMANVLSVLSFGHCIVYPFFWPLRPKERTNNTMIKRKDRQYNGQEKAQTIQWPKKRQTIQWPRERTDNTMTKRKDKQYVCPFSWPLYFLSFLMANVLSVLSFGHCIVYPFFWPLYCLSFLLAIVLSEQYNDQKKGQKIH
jgi:quinol-cytochrome oxidoreductase complex cytochrome b subunit